jgi:hypothetical protein
MTVISSNFVLASYLRTNNPTTRKNTKRPTRVLLTGPSLFQLQYLTEPGRYSTCYLIKDQTAYRQIFKLFAGICLDTFNIALPFLRRASAASLFTRILEPIRRRNRQWRRTDWHYSRLPRSSCFREGQRCILKQHL